MVGGVMRGGGSFSHGGEGQHFQVGVFGGGGRGVFGEGGAHRAHFGAPPWPPPFAPQFYGYLSQQQNMMQDYVRTGTYQRAILQNHSDFKDKVTPVTPP